MEHKRRDKDEIFNAAAESKDPAERAAFLDNACADDLQLRAEIEELLDLDQQAGSFLAAPAVGPPPTIDRSLTESRGTVIGPYKILQKIGEGGMGVVYMAEQTQPVKRRVALKIIKPGMDSRQVIARFEAERQALAMMDHPHIAKVLDAGTTASGRPYFAMELVKGIPITRYCDEHHLTPRQRLELFASVCMAVQHAHQKGVIHRDLKPSNVLVAHYDSEPVVKIIDFGVAKATGQQLTEKTLFTQFGQVVGTLEYMSPEQARFNQLDIDTRSDIYSLGVLLYELLTGVTPFDSERLQSAALDEVMRIIREEEPPKPSTRVSAARIAPAASVDRCKTEPGKLFSILCGDLDWLVMKALSKERDRRYETASGMAADIQRYLAGEPIEARPPSTVYRLRKTIARHRIGLAAVAVVILALVMATGVSTWNWRDAVHAREEAVLQRSVAVDLAEDLQGLVVEKALDRAVAGDLEGVEATLAEYEKRLQPETRWLETLKGAAYVHRGDHAKAIEVLDPVVRASPENIAAAGLLALSYWHEGYWLKGTVIANRIRDSKPRAKFRDFDLLFQGYAFYWLDTRRSMEIFNQLVKRHPDWGMVRVYRAVALTLVGENERCIKYIEDAVKEIDAAGLLLKDDDNALVTGARLFIEFKVMELYPKYGESQQRVDQARTEGLRLAEQMCREHPDSAVGLSLAASFYGAYGDGAKAEGIHLQLLARDTDLYRQDAIGYYYSRHTSEETLDLIQQLKGAEDDWLVKASKAYVLADIPGGEFEARQIYKELCQQHTSTWMRCTAIQILFLLGDTEEAQEQCRKWLEEDRHNPELRKATLSMTREDLSLKVYAESNGAEKVGKYSTLYEGFHVEFPLAILAISNGDRESALKHLEACREFGNAHSAYFWVEAFIKHINESNDWPRENKVVGPTKR